MREELENLLEIIWQRKDFEPKKVLTRSEMKIK